MKRMKNNDTGAVVRPLTEKDTESVRRIDFISSNNVSEWLYSEGYAWGIFLGEELIGYCTIGGADDLEEAEEHPLYTYESRLLSDVYILATHRHKGYGLKLIKEVLEKTYDGEAAFLTLLYDSLSEFYEKAGFEWAFGKAYIMVKKP